MILITPAIAQVKNERLSPTNKAKREASRNKFMEKSWLPDGVESFGQVDSREDHPRARPGFVKVLNPSEVDGERNRI